MATTLFNNARNIAEINSVLARYGYGDQTLRDEQALIAAYQQALKTQAQAKGTAKQATRAQLEALAALNMWLAQYLKIAKIALDNQPELLKSLGITKNSRRVASSASAVTTSVVS